MERRDLGQTGISVPTVGLGTYRVFNVNTDPERARCEAVVEAAIAGSDGPALFDTSPMYGRAENVLADTLSGNRDKAIVATKVWSRVRAVGEGQIEHALRIYERVDIYQVHNLLAHEAHLPYLQHLKDGGRVRAVGATHYLPSQMSELVGLMKRRQVDMVQVPYHPLERTIEDELLPAAADLGIGVLVMTPLGAGALLGKQPRESELTPLIRHGVDTWAQIILKWILSDERVTAVIPATQNAAHMIENLAAGEPPWFNDDERTYIQRLAAKLNA